LLKVTQVKGKLYQNTVSPELVISPVSARVKNSPLKMGMEPSVVVHICNPSYSGDRGRRITSSRPTWAKLVNYYLKKKTKTKVLGIWLTW
jgi:hypothetical protein